MTHYIDAEQLKAELDKRYTEYRAKMKTDDFTYYEGMADALDLFEQYIDSLQQEQPKGLHFTPFNRLIQKIPSKNWNDTVNNYAKKLRNCLITEGYRKDAEVLQGYISYMNGNNVPMATMDQQEQPDKDKKTFDDYLKVSPSERRKMNMTEILGEEKLAETKKQMKQPEVNFEKELEEEIERFYRTDEYRIADALGRGFETLARHFAEWGAKHLKR